MSTRWRLSPAHAATPALAERFGTLAACMAASGEPVTRDAISEVVRVTVGSRRYYVKRYQGRGPHPRRLFAHRLILEWTNLQRFARWGIPTAEPVAWGDARVLGVFMHGCLVTEEITDTMDLERLAREQPQRLHDPAWFRPLCHRLAAIVRTLHGQGFTHNDLFWRNVLVRPESGELFLIDCPNGTFWWGPLLDYRIVKDLANLDKTARKTLRATQRMRFLLDYLDMPSLDAHGKQLARRVLAAWHRRRKRKGMA